MKCTPFIIIISDVPNPRVGYASWARPCLDKICPNVIVYHASHTQALYQMTNHRGYLLDQSTQFCFVVARLKSTRVWYVNAPIYGGLLSQWSLLLITIEVQYHNRLTVAVFQETEDDGYRKLNTWNIIPILETFIMIMAGRQWKKANCILHYVKWNYLYSKYEEKHGALLFFIAKNMMFNMRQNVILWWICLTF